MSRETLFKRKEMLMYYFFLAMAIICEVTATNALKFAAGFTQIGPSLIVLIGYGASFYFFSLCIQKIPLGIAYAIWSGVGILLVAILGTIIHQQKLDSSTIFGIMLIILGVVIVNYSSWVMSRKS